MTKLNIDQLIKELQAMKIKHPDVVEVLFQSEEANLSHLTEISHEKINAYGRKYNAIVISGEWTRGFEYDYE